MIRAIGNRWGRWGGLFLSTTLVLLLGCSGPEKGPGPQPGSETSPQDPPAASAVSFEHEPNILHILVDGGHFADYVYYDRETPRPHFANVKAPGGIQVTRNRPPLDGQDLMDHAHMHPGIWLSFGDLSGNDYWRLKSRVEHERFVEKPQPGVPEGSFAVRNYYWDQSGENRIAQEESRYSLSVHPEGYLLAADSTFRPYSGVDRIVFGDQEEMGFSVRLHTSLVEQFGGEIVDSRGRIGAEAIWSQSADWIDYAGEVQGRWVGVTLIPHPDNFRESWYHVRDYGLLAANPFGREAMGKGPRSEVIVMAGESLRLRFGLVIHSSESKEEYAPENAFRRYLGTMESDQPEGAIR